MGKSGVVLGPNMRWFAWLVVLGVLVCGLGLGASRALAADTRLTQTDQPLPGSNFQGADGNQEDENTFIDWQELQSRNPPDLVHVRDPNGNQTENSFRSGSKEDAPNTWTITTTPVDNKDDILDTYQSFERGSNGDAFLLLGMTRATDTGTTFWTFELNQTSPVETNSEGFAIPCRETGDLLITVDQDGNQDPDATAGETDVSMAEWVTDTINQGTGCAATGHLEPVTGLTDNVVQGALNADPIHSFLPWDFENAAQGAVADQIPARQFVEAAINLTAVMKAMGETSCSDQIFESIWAHSRASESDESELKDYVAPTPFDVSVCKQHPHLTSHTPRHVQLGPSTSIQDTATLRGGDPNATGTITFRLYGPNDRRCSGDPIFQSPRNDPDASGVFTSDPFTPTRVGTYRWTVEYSGDNNDVAAGPTRCGRRTETFVVSRARPSITTVASPATDLPGPIHDTATLLGGVRPRGTIKFEVFGPDDATCTGTPAHTSTVQVMRGNRTYTSPDFTPTSAGTWRWVATYSGNHNNHSAATTCSDLGESVPVSAPPPTPPAAPGLTTTASAGGPVGSPVIDTAHLTGGANPTGTITFFVYGPDDPGCATPAAPPSTVSVSGARDYQSPPFRPTEVGTYRWVVSYSGDAANAAAASSCGEPGEMVVMSQAQPTITVTPTQPVVRQGNTVDATAVLTGGAHPRETITFHLYGPGNRTCSGTPVFVGRQKVLGNGTYRSPLHAPALPGNYRWKATYSGDRNHAPASSACSRPVRVHPRRAVQEREEPRPRPAPKPPPPRVTG